MDIRRSEKYKGIVSFLFPKPKQILEGCKVWIRACGRPHDQLLFVGCLTSQQNASVSHGRICSDDFTRCHTEIEVADQTFHLTQSQYIDTRPTSPSTDPITPGATGVPIFQSLV